MQIEFIDSHCHLEKGYYGEAVPEVIARANSVGVRQMIAVGSSGASVGAVEALALTKQFDCIYSTAGIHPHEAEKSSKEHVDTIFKCLEDDKCVSVGEIGLDYFYDNAPRAKQKEVFELFLSHAVEINKPIMLHIRDAYEDSYEILNRIGLPEAGGVIHCFSAGVEEAKRYLDMGFYLSIPGIITFKKAQNLRDALEIIPLDRILVETDAPYLAPVPHRGKQNEPSFVIDTAKKVAELKGISLKELSKATLQNTIDLFGLN